MKHHEYCPCIECLGVIIKNDEDHEHACQFIDSDFYINQDDKIVVLDNSKNIREYMQAVQESF